MRLFKTPGRRATMSSLVPGKHNPTLPQEYKPQYFSFLKAQVQLSPDLPQPRQEQVAHHPLTLSNLP